METNDKQRDSREYLANERTFLAWVRTGIGIMAFGFVVVKFSLFVRQLTLLTGKVADLPNKGYSSVIGIVILILGAFIIPLAYFRYRQVNSQLDEGKYTNSKILPLLLTVLLMLVSLTLIIYMISSVKL
jgi:putative membrane protein